MTHGNRLNYPEFYEAKNTIAATEMKCIAFSQSLPLKTYSRFHGKCARRLSKILNSVTNEPNSAWSETFRPLTRWQYGVPMFGGWNAVESNWPEIPLKTTLILRRRSPIHFMIKAAFIDMTPFILSCITVPDSYNQDPVNVIRKAYDRMVQSKPQGNMSWEEWLEWMIRTNM